MKMATMKNIIDTGLSLILLPIAVAIVAIVGIGCVAEMIHRPREKCPAFDSPAAVNKLNCALCHTQSKP